MTLTGARLVELSRPAAVLGRVGALRIEAINGVIQRRPWAHVFKERFKGVHPSVAHCDAPSAVAVIVRGLGVSATLFHRSPGAVFRSRRSSETGRSMTRDRLQLKASATEVLPPSQVATNSPRHASTVADTCPRSFLPLMSFKAQNSEPSESHTNQINRSGQGRSSEWRDAASIAEVAENIYGR